MKNHLVIIRGLPGSGKSTVARSMVGYAHYEADMYFLDNEGLYNFNPKLLRDAHEWCQRQVKSALNNRINVVVSNTFTQIWEMQPYLNMGYPTNIIECKGRFNNIHGVPCDAIKRMSERWESIS